MDKLYRAKVIQTLADLMDGPFDGFTVYALSDILVHMMIAIGTPREEAIASFEKLARSHFWVAPQQLGGFAMLVDAETKEPIDNPAPFTSPRVVSPEQFAQLARDVFEGLPPDVTGATPYDSTARRLFDQVFTKESGNG